MNAKNINKKKVNPKRVVILGSGGFVSGNLSRLLKVKKIKILEISRKKIDLTKDTSIKKLSRIIKKDDAVFFAAAKAPVKNENMLNDNLLMCKNVCLALRNNSFSHFIYLSSDAIYSDSSSTINENFLSKPDNLHGFMHLAREKIFQNFISAPFLILRPTLIYGFDDPHNGYGPNMFRRLVMKNKSIELFGRGEERRDHIHIEDVTDIIYQTLIYKTVGKLNVVTGKVTSFLKIAELIKKKYKSENKIIYKKRIGKMPHNGYRSLSNSGLKKLFHYKKFREII